jgi:eukaryotic-like serine/threonine-protein kinase
VNAVLASPSSATISAGGDAALSLPARIGPYEITGKLGEGTMGVVFAALDPRLKRKVALKTVRPQAPGSSAAAAALRRLQHEAQAAARLAHPGIVAIYEYGEEGGQAFIAMEHVAGTPLLWATGRPERLGADDVLCVMVQLLAALQCAHEQGVWHRDIKPANLMITREGRLKIADFGIARIDAAAAAREAGAIGTPGYMAPECYDSAGIDHRADLYACGVLLYELLAGVRPFRGSPDAVKAQTLQASVPALPAPSPFEPVLQRALAKEASRRFASADEMRHALMAVAQRAVPNALSAQAMRLLTPAPQAAPPPPIAPALIDAVAALLAQELGPLAFCLTRRAAARSDSASALVMRLANEALPAEQRALFIERARVLLPREIAPPAPAAPAAAPPPLLGATPLEPRLVEAARAMLAQQMGPLATTLVQRAARNGATREQFIERLSALAADPVADPDEYERLAEALCRLR